MLNFSFNKAESHTEFSDHGQTDVIQIRFHEI